MVKYMPISLGTNIVLSLATEKSFMKIFVHMLLENVQSIGPQSLGIGSNGYLKSLIHDNGSTFLGGYSHI